MEKEINLDSQKTVGFRLKNKKKYLSFEISKRPDSLDFKTDDEKSEVLKKIYEKEKKRYRKVNEYLYIYDDLDFKGFLKIGIGSIIIGVLSIIVLKIKGDSLYFYMIPVLFGVIQIVYLLLKKKKKLFVLDRQNQIINYPNFLLGNPVNIKFKDTPIFIGSVGRYGASALKIKHPNNITSYSFSILDTNFWSFMVWYMDKNRPLPPGDAFDAYRQKDFERRKSEGFPPPLYYSNGVLTPEATPEQQLEREQYWKDQEYFAPPIKRPENSEIFNTRTHKNWEKVTFDRNGDILSNTWHEFTFNDKVVYMLTNENGSGYLPPENESYKVASLTLKDSLF